MDVQVPPPQRCGGGQLGREVIDLLWGLIESDPAATGSDSVVLVRIVLDPPNAKTLWVDATTFAVWGWCAGAHVAKRGRRRTDPSPVSPQGWPDKPRHAV